jgi:dethiobiotin synthetase
MKRIFVSGISTDVGKTVTSAILTEALQADYWKPVQSGNYHGTDSESVRSLICNPKTKFHPEAYSLKHPMSPHAAAELEGIEIDIDKITLPETDNTLVIEGAGGLMVPINKKHFVIDLIKKFDAPVVLVIQNYLGSINHSLLSIDALRSRNVKLAGVVINGPRHEMSEEIILKYAGVKCIGRILPENEINKEVVCSYATKFKIEELWK